ncbi:zinc-ribbon domain-containing protein [Bacillus sp. ISL-55]|uniref:TcaA 3rd/4th domain-containing protein n=1 Tax=Bacillus sp. ISL-55 TaxID=2819134 RepID=UPI001BE5F1E8|nr:zinc-ribbon domain-containing protein [Bacillus sp. ISL-55]MBT2692575.1 zinc-ribbon domain-containing protein [Bacillus sp. ISL-55]
MNFCNECGSKLQPGSTFCTNCGHKYVPPKAVNLPANDYCNTCGEAIGDAPHHCLEVVKPQKKSRGKSKAIIGAVAAVLLIAAGMGAFFYAKAESSPGQTANLLTESMKKGHLEEMSGLIIRSDNEKALNRSELEQLNALFEDSEEALMQTEKSIKEQETYLESGKGEKVNPVIFEISRKKDKKYLLIDQYEVLVHPVSFSVEVDPDAQLFINEKEIKNSSKTPKVKGVLPGSYDLLAVKDGEFGALEKKTTLQLWSDITQPVSLLFEENYVTVKNPFGEVELYLDGKLHVSSSESVIKAGPIPAGRAVTIQARVDYPWGEAATEEYVANAGESISLEMENATDEISYSVFNSIYNYNRSYIDSIVYVDPTYLVNVSGKKLEKILDTITDLKSRNVSYAGELNNMTFDAASLELDKNGNKYIATVNVAEEYLSGWKQRDALEEPDLSAKTYYYKYIVQYNPAENSWIVIDNVEQDSITFNDPVVLGN